MNSNIKKANDKTQFLKAKKEAESGQVEEIGDLEAFNKWIDQLDKNSTD